MTDVEIKPKGMEQDSLCLKHLLLLLLDVILSEELTLRCECHLEVLQVDHPRKSLRYDIPYYVCVLMLSHSHACAEQGSTREQLLSEVLASPLLSLPKINTRCPQSVGKKDGTLRSFLG